LWPIKGRWLRLVVEIRGLWPIKRRWLRLIVEIRGLLGLNVSLIIEIPETIRLGLELS